jgi:hypothetical protein
MRDRSAPVAAVLAALAWLGVAGCQTAGGSCPAGVTCECQGGNDCYQGCADVDGCDLLCHNMNHCGGVCGNGCTLEGHDVIDFSADCGDNCNILCHNTTSCGAFCGANCQYDCHDVNRCGVRAGPGSLISCANVTTCAVECLGNCQLSCNDANPCDLTCPAGAAVLSCPNGNLACGSC